MKFNLKTITAYIALLVLTTITAILLFNNSTDKSKDDQSVYEKTKTIINFYTNSCPQIHKNIYIPEEKLKKEYFSVNYGDHLFSIIKRATNLKNSKVYQSIQNIKKTNPSLVKIFPEQKYRTVKKNDKVIYFDLFYKQFQFARINLTEDNYLQVELGEITPEIEYKTKNGFISHSLYEDALDNGIDHNKIREFVNIYAWDVDFNRDINQGDEYHILYEEYYKDGEFFGNGRIIAAHLKTRRDNFFAFGFLDEKEFSYYDENGKSLQKAFLKSPVEAALVTSKFTYKRWHPILKVNRPHRGVDYGGSLNTPVIATSDGILEKQRKEHAYGNVIVINHGGGYKTLYAHLNKFNKKFNTGDEIKQGDIIGYMGTTGLSTGVHLHYELRINNKHQDPLTIDLPDGKKVSDMDLFNNEINVLKNMLFNKEKEA